MTDETTNSAAAESALSRPLTLDEAANLDLQEPEEANPEAEAAANEGEPTEDAAEAGASADDEDQAGEEQEDEAGKVSPEAEPADTLAITVAGLQIPLKDLKAGYMKSADYNRKTQELAAHRRNLEAMTEQVGRSANVLAEFLARQIPDAPHPSLAGTNPGEYVRQKAQHEAALAQVQSLLTQTGQVKTVAAALTEQQHTELLAQEAAKLAERFPTTGTPDGRKAFFDTAAAAARDLGYAPEEIATVTDHRMFALAHYAAIGFRAEQAKAKAAAKVANVPPVATPKQRKSAEASTVARNREAMKRLARTGSIEDAMAIDFT
ncbi:hypothetical protein [Xanthobacter sediminis]